MARGTQAGARRRQGDAAPAALEERTADDGLERRHLPGDRRLRVAERLRGGRERAGLRDLAQDPQPGGRELSRHALAAW